MNQKKILQAAKAKFAHRQEGSKLHKVCSMAFFEHSQWWFRISDWDHGVQETYSVVEAVPGIGGTDLDFGLLESTNF